MGKKLKGRANPLSELHFIANVSLEQAVMLIQDLADDTYAVTLTEVDADSFEFEIDDTRQQSRQSKINGTLQRWQGTDTRVDATGDVVRDVVSSKTLTSFIFMLVFFAIGFLMLANGMISTEHGLVYGLPALAIMSIGVFLLRQYRESADEDSILQVHFRERDRLLQLLIDRFKSAATVEAYEPTTQIKDIAFPSNEAQYKAKNR